VKVCWAAADRSKNCGICDKCIRTRLNFKAVGIDNPSCFDGELTHDQIRRASLINETQRAGFQSIIDYANRRGVSGDWLDAAGQCLRYHERGPMGRAATHLAYGDFSLVAAKVWRRLSRSQLLDG
jgi:hypothetical protein